MRYTRQKSLSAGIPSINETKTIYLIKDSKRFQITAIHINEAKLNFELKEHENLFKSEDRHQSPL